MRGILAGAPRMRRPGQNPAPGGGAIAPELVYGGVGGGVPLGPGVCWVQKSQLVSVGPAKPRVRLHLLIKV